MSETNEVAVEYRATDEGSAPAGAKNQLLPAILMMVLCFVFPIIKFVFSINFRAFSVLYQHGATEAISAMWISLGISLGHMCINQLLGLIPALLVFFLRKKRLSAVRYRDLVVVGVMLLGANLFSRLGAAANTATYNALGSSAAVAVSSAGSVINLTSGAVLLSWLGLTLFFLARTGAKKLSLILWAVLSAGGTVKAVLVAVFAVPLIRLFNASPEIVEMSSQYLRVAMLMSIIGPAVSLLFWYGLGSEYLHFVPALIYGPAMGVVSLLVNYSVMLLCLHVMHLGVVSSAIPAVISDVLSAVYLAVFITVGAVRAKVRAKKLAQPELN